MWRSSPRRLFVLALSAVAFAVPAAADAVSHPSEHGLRISPPVGAFGAIPVGSCDLATYAGCKIITFTVENTGSHPIAIGGFGVVAGAENAALVPGTPGSGCEFLPLVGGLWSLAPGASCRIAVVFSPTGKGHEENELRIWVTHPSDPLAVIPLFGVGI
jgi:hypothetical protein